jgi:proteasome lid subunit RPN8/RPN11
MLRLPPECWERIRSHAAAAYPEECCGALVGDLDFAAGVRTVRETVPLTNAAPDRMRHYRVPPVELLPLFRREDEPGRTVLGFYHSHPDGPARPSATDAAEAAPGFAYLIIAVPSGVPAGATAWLFGPDEPVFTALALT